MKEASRQEIIRRYFKTACEYKKGYVDKETFERVSLLMDELGLKVTDRRTVMPARMRAETLAEENGELTPVVALELHDHTIVTGKKSGRGAYVCPDLECLKRARKARALERAFSAPMPDGVYDALEEQMKEGGDG